MGVTSTASANHGSFEVLLPPQPSSVAAARHRVADLLTGSGREDLADPTVLLVSEIVTNALLHAGTDIELRVALDDSGVRVEVGDGSLHLPSRRSYAATAGTGRGLMMLESLVDDWGVTMHRDGKTVWFHLSSGDRTLVGPAERQRDGSGARRARAASVAVELRNMPLLLHAAWQEHAEALLREYLLASLDSQDEDPIQMHAEATDAIAVLEEHIPRTPLRIELDELMADAADPQFSAPRVEVPVPRDSVAHFETLDRAIDAALDLSREGVVLTPPSQPEVQSFRRWLCRQVLRQSAGSAPEPWSVPDEGRGELETPTGWDPATVLAAEHGVIAANQVSQIIAVSSEAARILGYDDRDELVGKRVVSIVPERYRQAHVAGFTMYLLVGRRPLLNRAVVIAARRRDGTEVDVELLVREDVMSQGGSVLLADIRLAPTAST